MRFISSAEAETAAAHPTLGTRYPPMQKDRSNIDNREKNKDPIQTGRSGSAIEEDCNREGEAEAVVQRTRGKGHNQPADSARCGSNDAKILASDSDADKSSAGSSINQATAAVDAIRRAIPLLEIPSNSLSRNRDDYAHKQENNHSSGGGGENATCSEKEEEIVGRRGGREMAVSNSIRPEHYSSANTDDFGSNDDQKRRMNGSTEPKAHDTLRNTMLASSLSETTKTSQDAAIGQGLNTGAPTPYDSGRRQQRPQQKSITISIHQDPVIVNTSLPPPQQQQQQQPRASSLPKNSTAYLSDKTIRSLSNTTPTTDTENSDAKFGDALLREGGGDGYFEEGGGEEEEEPQRDLITSPNQKHLEEILLKAGSKRPSGRKDAFVAHEAVSYMVNSGRAKNRQHAVEIGNKFLRMGWIKHATGTVLKFSDAHILFKHNPKRAMQVRYPFSSSPPVLKPKSRRSALTKGTAREGERPSALVDINGLWGPDLFGSLDEGGRGYGTEREEMSMTFRSGQDDSTT
eukprot:jgi/Bigna1/143664/aug1.80_g18372